MSQTLSKKDADKEVWDAFNRWMLDMLSQEKTAHIPFFAYIGWKEVVEKRIGSETYKRIMKPYFQLTEQFRRSIGLMPLPEVEFPQLRHIEELNYSKIALRYSKTITRDQVCTILKRKFMKLAQDIGAGQKLSLTFAFGILTAENYHVHFNFLPEIELYGPSWQDHEYENPDLMIPDSTYTLENPAVRSNISSRPSTMQSYRHNPVAQSATNILQNNTTTTTTTTSPIKQQTNNNNNNNNNNSITSSPMVSRPSTTMSNRSQSYTPNFNKSYGKSSQPKQTKPQYFSIIPCEKFHPLHAKKYQPKIASQKVLDEAYQRRLNELDSLHEQNEFFDTVEKATLEYATQEEERRRNEQKLKDKQLQLEHIKQMKQRELQKAEEHDYNHYIPPANQFSATMIGAEYGELSHKEMIMNRTRRDLETQMEFDTINHKAQKERELQDDKDYLESVNQEVKRQIEAEKNDRYQTRKELEEVWKKEMSIKALNDKLNKTNNRAFSPDIGDINGIGFDTRNL